MRLKGTPRLGNNQKAKTHNKGTIKMMVKIQINLLITVGKAEIIIIKISHQS